MSDSTRRPKPAEDRLLDAPRGRGALSNADGRFESYRHAAADDGWGSLDEALPPFKTTVSVGSTRTIDLGQCRRGGNTRR